MVVFSSHSQLFISLVGLSSWWGMNEDCNTTVTQGEVWQTKIQIKINQKRNRVEDSSEAEVTHHQNMNLLSDRTPGVRACVAAFPLSRPNFLSLDWRWRDPFPAALKNTFHFNVAAPRKVICHLIMTEKTQRHVSVKCVRGGSGRAEGAGGWGRGAGGATVAAESLGARRLVWTFNTWSHHPLRCRETSVTRQGRTLPNSLWLLPVLSTPSVAYACWRAPAAVTVIRAGLSR